MGRFPSCSICIDKFIDFADISACPCGHTFHRECLAGWVSHSAARGQPPTCPTCAKPFENRPAMGVIQSLYFSFDADGQTPEFHDEFLAKQMDHNESLTSDIAARDAEIRDLRAQLASSKADLQALRETVEKEKKALETQLNTKHAIAEAGLQGVITHLRGELATSQADMKTLVAGFKVADAELATSQADLKVLVAGFKVAEAELKELEIKKQPSSSAKWNDDCSRHVVISNLQFKVHPNALRARLAKWNPEDVKMTTDPHGIGTAYVTLRNSDDAHEVISRLHGCDWYGRRLIVRHAIGDEVQELCVRQLRVSNYSPTSSNQDFGEFLADFESVEAEDIDYDFTPGWKYHLFTFYTSCDAKAFLQKFNNRLFCGKEVKVEFNTR